MQITIRPIEARDKPQWRHLWTGYLEFYETTVPDAVYDTTFERLVSPGHPAQHGLLAWRSKERPVG